MKEWGPVFVGSPAADFGIISLREETGRVITGHHSDILNYVGVDEVPEETADHVIGRAGRAKRHQDSQTLHVVHVEDKRVA